ncbi:MAG: response regulator, partial [Okeania sp. SIO2D1]|nr:response regulator [Okeania sp. SIO2D1]
MNDTQQLPISIQPIISYPREAEVGKTYLMEVDIKQTGDFDKWNYEEEEYPIYCRVDTYCQGDTTPLFKIKTIGEPAVILHRFGGTYGAAKFLLTAAEKEMKGEIRVTLVNGWGVSLKRLRLEDVAVVTEISDDPVIALFKVISQNTPPLKQFEFETEVATIEFEHKLKHILLVEDEQEVVEEISGILLSQYEIQVTGTDRVNEVIELAESGEIDLILINYGLYDSRYQDRKVNGLEFVRILKANSEISPKKLPIVGFSLNNDIADEFIESGADGFYSKQELFDSGDYQKFVDYLQNIFNQAIETTSSKPGKNYGIVIGINQYNNLPSLQYAYAAIEGKAMQTFTRQQNFGEVFFLREGTFAKVEEFLAVTFEKLCLSTKDNLWFFFSG